MKISTNAAKWALILVWSNRLLGLLSTLILVKFLTPYDFGVAMTAVIVQGFAQSFTEIGYKSYLIKNNCRDYLRISSAWTLSIVFKSSSVLFIIFLAVIARYHYDSIDVSNVLIVSSVIPALTALINPGLVLDEMDDNYKNISLIPIYTKLVTVPLTIVLAIVYQNFWSVVCAGIVGASFNVYISYVLNSFRPSFTFHEIRKQMDFAKNIFAYSILGFLRSRLENFSVLYLFGIKGNGNYTVTQEFAYLPLTEIATPLSRGFFASASALKTNAERLQLMSKYMNLGFLILIPCFFGSLAIAEVFTEVVLGKQWLEVAPLISVFCLVSIQLYMLNLISNLFVINERFKFIYSIDLVYVLSIGFVTLAIGFQNVIYFTIARVVISYAVCCLSLYLLYKLVGKDILCLLKSLPSILFASFAMCFVVYFSKILIQDLIVEEHNLLLLITLVLLGFIVYAVLMYMFSILFSKNNRQMQEIKNIFDYTFSYFKKTRV